jgi:hypothetical protein
MTAPAVVHSRVEISRGLFPASHHPSGARWADGDTVPDSCGGVPLTLRRSPRYDCGSAIGEFRANPPTCAGATHHAFLKAGRRARVFSHCSGPHRPARGTTASTVGAGLERGPTPVLPEDASGPAARFRLRSGNVMVGE